MARCDWCRELVGFDARKTSSGLAVWHTRCWNEAAEQRADHAAELDDCEGFAVRQIAELPAARPPAREKRGPVAMPEYAEIGNGLFARIEKRR